MPLSLNYRFLLQVAIAMAVITAILGLLILHVLGHHEKWVPVWGQESMATDLVSFSLAFGFILSFVVTKLTRYALRTKRVLPLHWHLKSQTLIDRLPSHIIHRAFMLALAGVLLAVILLFLIRLRNIEALTYRQYKQLFVVYAVSLATAITIMAVYRALGDRTGKQSVTENESSPSL